MTAGAGDEPFAGSGRQSPDKEKSRKTIRRT